MEHILYEITYGLMAKIIKLIYTEERVGTGKDDDPIRKKPQLWSCDGELIAVNDPYKGTGYFYSESIKFIN